MLLFNNINVKVITETELAEYRNLGGFQFIGII